MVWLVIGMAIFNNKPMSHLVNLMDIVDRTGRSFTAPGSVIIRRKTLGEDAIRVLFNLPQQRHAEAKHSPWHRLTLNAVDGVVWHTQDTPENAEAFGKASNQHGGQDELRRLKTSPQVRKQWEGLPEEMTVRLIRRKVNGVERQVLTSMTDVMRISITGKSSQDTGRRSSGRLEANGRKWSDRNCGVSC